MTKISSEKTLFNKEQELLHLKHLNRELKVENAKLHKKLAKLEAKNVTLTNRANELKRLKAKNAPKKKPLTNIEMARAIAFAAHLEGITPDEFIEKHTKS